jgi:hypothetical protein
MLRKLFWWGLALAIIGGLAYGYMYYAVVALYEPSTPKVTYLMLVKKPERDFTFFYNYIDKEVIERQVKNIKASGQQVPWHMDYEWLEAHSIYTITMDNRQFAPDK